MRRNDGLTDLKEKSAASLEIRSRETENKDADYAEHAVCSFDSAQSAYSAYPFFRFLPIWPGSVPCTAGF